jgi:CRISPR-associated protein Csb2
VNEGMVEWPPSPWRLLRGLLATGYAKLGWKEPPNVARSLIDKLASALPSYGLPDASGAHSRHYMPMAVFDKGREKTTLVFDTWAQIQGGEMTIAWPVSLDEFERHLLGELTERLSYLGRSESWVVARIAEDAPRRHDAYPCNGAPHPGPGWEQVALLAPEPPEVARAFLDAQAMPALENSRREPRGSVASVARLPGDLLDCLHLETRELHAQGWSQPPGSRRVLYWRRTDVLDASGPPQRSAHRTASTVESILLALANPSGNAHALPSVTRTLPQGELLHRALVSRATRFAPPNWKVEVITGMDSMGAPLIGHRHNHVLYLDLDGDGHLDHVLLWAPAGLSGHIQSAVLGVRETYAKSVSGKLALALTARGALSHLTALPAPWGPALGKVLGPSRNWYSRTPFVPPRFLKPRGKNALGGQVAAEIACRGLPQAEMELVDVRDRASLMLRHFARVRRHGPPPPVDCGFQIRLRFAEPIAGPLCFGYGSHFGLGRFESEA